MDPLHHEEPSDDITRLIRAWRTGETSSVTGLIEVAYPKLKRLAETLLQRETPGHTLQATGLVNELYLMLVKQRNTAFESRGHFYSFAVFLMRTILRDWARDRKALKRGGERAVRIPLSPDLAWIDAGSEEMLDLDTALEELEVDQPRKVRLIELTAFLGCTTVEAAEIVGVSKPTADRELRVARAWLYRRLRGES